MKWGLEMVKPDLILRTHRRSLSITITKNAELVIRAPKRMSMDKIMSYVNEKEKWITTKQKEIQDRLNINKEVIQYNEFLFLGKKYKIEYVQGLKKIELSSTHIMLPMKYNNELRVKHIKYWYISNAKKILSDRLEYLAGIMQLDYASFTINNSKSRWGSCDINRNIKLNYRLVMLPHKIIDYIIIHELSHIIEFNHSKEFYKIISMIMPGYKLQQKQLKNYDYLLSLYR